MKKSKVVCWIIIAIVVIALFPYRGVRFSPKAKVQEGDVIFHMSTSSQSPLVTIATLSPLTHCGVIVIKGDEPYVLEASSTLKTTPLRTFIKRRRCGAYWIKRQESGIGKKIRYSHLLGRSYDMAFSFDNNKYYCSELVYDIYKYQLGIELCSPKPMNHYFTLGMKKKMRQRGMNPNGLVVAPKDIFGSNFLKFV